MHYEKEIQSLLAALVAAGFQALRCDYAGEDPCDPTVANLAAADECNLIVRDTDGRELGLFLVLGNCAGELVCDYPVHAALAAVVTAEAEKWTNAECTEDANTESEPDYGGVFDGLSISSDAEGDL
jgi:hypothetical protein